MLKVVYSPGAERDLYSLPRDIFDSFQAAFDALEASPSNQDMAIESSACGGRPETL